MTPREKEEMVKDAYRLMYEHLDEVIRDTMEELCRAHTYANSIYQSVMALKVDEPED